MITRRRRPAKRDAEAPLEANHCAANVNPARVLGVRGALNGLCHFLSPEALLPELSVITDRIRNL